MSIADIILDGYSGSGSSSASSVQIPVGDLIRQALGLTNAVGIDQTLTAQETTDCIYVLNDILEDLSNQNLAIWSSATQAFNTIGGKASYTIGSGGDWDTTRPIRLNDNAYCTYQGIDYEIDQLNQTQYNLINLKNQQEYIVRNLLFVNDFALGIVTLWPVPAIAIPITLSIDVVLSRVTSNSQVLSFPPGYLRLYKYLLGIELAPLFGKAASADVKQIAVSTLANIKRVNKNTPVSRFDTSLVQNVGVIWQRGY